MGAQTDRPGARRVDRARLTLVFLTLGASARLLALRFFYARRWIEIGGGVLLVRFGLSLIGALKASRREQ